MDELDSEGEGLRLNWAVRFLISVGRNLQASDKMYILGCCKVHLS